MTISKIDEAITALCHEMDRTGKAVVYAPELASTERQMYGEKLIVLVMNALRDGADTSNEIAEMIGRPVGSVSATLSEMEQSGLAKKTGRWKYMIEGRRTKSYCYELSNSQEEYGCEQHRDR